MEDRKAADDDDDERKGRAGSEMVEGEVVGEEATTDGTQDDDDDRYEYEYIEVEVGWFRNGFCFFIINL